MRVSVSNFRAEHVTEIEFQRHDGSKEEQLLSSQQFIAVENAGRSKTIFIDGQVRACVGVVEYWPGRGAVWAIIDRRAVDCYLPLIRTLKRLLDAAPERRLESTVVASFDKGHKLNRILGFTLEAPLMKNYGELGTTYSLYSRTK